MAAASSTPGTRVVVSSDGTLGGLVDPRQVVMVRLPMLERDAEVGLNEEADVTLLGEPPHLVIVTRTGLIHVVNPRGKDGPEKVGEVSIDPGSRVVAAMKEHLVVTTPAGPVIVAASGTQLTITRLPLRGVVDAAGASADDRFVVSVGGALEEWSAEMRAPLRRFRLEKPLVARFVGGNAQRLWVIPDATPNELVVVPLVGARPIKVDLPEPAVRVADDPVENRLAIVGGTTGAVYLVRLADRSVRSIHPGRVDDVVWSGPHALLCACDAVLEVLEIANASDHRYEEPEPAPAPRVPSTAERLAQWKQRARGIGPPEPEAAVNAPIVEPPPAPAPRAPVAPVSTGEPNAPLAPTPSLAPIAAATPAPMESTSALHEWRDAIAAWARRSLAGGRSEPPLIAAGPLHDVGIRLGLVGDEPIVLWLVYGARLCGYDGVAPVDIAPLVNGRWREALGRGRLRERGALRWRRNRVDLVREIAAAIDERPAACGTEITSATVATASAAIVAPATVDLAAIGAWAAPNLGSLIVPNARGLRKPDRLLLEGRARGRAVLLAGSTLAASAGDPASSIVFVVVASADDARALDLAVAYTWP